MEVTHPEFLHQNRTEAWRESEFGHTLSALPIMDNIDLFHSFSVFALFGVIWIIQLVHYPMFKLIEAPHWPRFHQLHSRNITFLVFPLMVVQLLSSLQLFMQDGNQTHIIYLACAVLSWFLTVAIFVPLHHKVAMRPLPNELAKLTNLNWLRTGVWTIAAMAVLASHFSQTL